MKDENFRVIKLLKEKSNSALKNPVPLEEPPFGAACCGY